MQPIATIVIIAISLCSIRLALGDFAMNDIQMKMSHNSYHLAQNVTLQYWNYSHCPLDVQAVEQGVRGFELDVWWNELRQGWDVYHLPVDPLSFCANLSECLQPLRQWSLDNPQHHYVVIFVEVKTHNSPPQAMATLQSEIVAALGGEQNLITPQALTQNRSFNSLHDAILANGWPSIESSRGRFLVYVNSGSVDGAVLLPDWRTAPVFLSGSTNFASEPWAAIVSIDDAIVNFDLIRRAVASGYIVRSRSDIEMLEAILNNSTRMQRALDSGAHIVATDLLTPENWPLYLALPGGTPSRCNPLRVCSSSADIEPLKFKPFVPQCAACCFIPGLQVIVTVTSAAPFLSLENIVVLAVVLLWGFVVLTTLI